MNMKTKENFYVNGNYDDQKTDKIKQFKVTINNRFTRTIKATNKEDAELKAIYDFNTEYCQPDEAEPKFSNQPELETPAKAPEIDSISITELHPDPTKESEA